MKQGHIIKKVSGVSPLVIVRKEDGKLRVCMDPKIINASFKRDNYPMPRREGIEAELAGAKFFSRLGANAGFHQVPLDQHSSKICTFATPFGRYRFLRLPFGISSASEVFQKALNEVFEGMPGVRVYVDDALIWGSDKAEHDQRLRSALRTAKSAGLTFNAQKCKFRVQEIEFLGDIISDEEINPNPV